MAPCFWELSCGQGEMWELLGLCLLVLDSILCLKFLTGQWGGRLLDCPFWLPIPGEMGTLFRKSEHVPREGLCSVWSPGEKERRQRHWEIWEKHDPSWTSKKRESRFSLGLRGAAQGWLQTGSTLELTKGQPSRWVQGMGGKKEICSHPFHWILPGIFEILYRKAYFLSKAQP